MVAQSDRIPFKLKKIYMKYIQLKSGLIFRCNTKEFIAGVPYDGSLYSGERRLTDYSSDIVYREVKNFIYQVSEVSATWEDKD